MNYILDEKGNPVLEPDLMRWADWFERNSRHVAQDIVAGYLISTVFLAIDHAFMGGHPILWETMIFENDPDVASLDEEYQERYSSEIGALAGHQRAIAYVKAMKKH